MTEPGASTTSGGWDGGRWVMVAGLVGMAVGVALDWVTAGPVGVAGLDTDDGKLFAVTLAAAVVLTILCEVNHGARSWWMAPFALGCGLLALSIYDITDISGSRVVAVGQVPLDVDVGVGLYLDAVGAAVLAVGAFVVSRRDTEGL